MLITIDGQNDERKLRIISKLKQSKDPEIYRFHSEVQHSVVEAELAANQIVIWNRASANLDNVNSKLKPDLSFILEPLLSRVDDSKHHVIDSNQPINEIIAEFNSSLEDIEATTLVFHQNLLDKLILLINHELQTDSTFDQLMHNRIANRIPSTIKPGSKEHARFMFFVTNNDHGVKSDILYDRAKKLYQAHPEYFDARFIAAKDIDFVKTNIAKEIGARYPAVAAENWYSNAVRIVDEFDGEPLNIFTSTSDAIVLFNLIKSFRGYGDKIGGMFTRSIANLKFSPELQNIDRIPVPTDTHIAALLFKVGILRTIKKPKLALYSNFARDEITAACQRHHLDWHRIDRALWLIESANLIDQFITNRLTPAL